VFGCQVTKRQTWPNGDARRWIHTAHDGVHVIAHGIQAVNDIALCIAYTRIAIGD
jgi:hypothetical protein